MKWYKQPKIRPISPRSCRLLVHIHEKRESDKIRKLSESELVFASQTQDIGHCMTFSE